MFPRARRLRVQNFPRRGAWVFKAPSFTAKLIPNNLEYSRFGVVVTAKLYPKATLRNQVKRQLLEVAAKTSLRSFDVLLLPHANPLPPSKKLQQEFEALALKHTS